ncbi:MAG: hypothetical protein WA364_25890, partial [Candidatus Nitrosopolaris sp.]
MIISYTGGLLIHSSLSPMARSTGIGLAVIGIMAMLGFVTIPAGMNNMGDSNDMHTSDISHT